MSTRSNKNINRNLIFFIKIYTVAGVPRDELSLKATYRKWPRSVDRSLKILDYHTMYFFSFLVYTLAVNAIFVLLLGLRFFSNHKLR